jgi:hypothetical protein
LDVFPSSVVQDKPEPPEEGRLPDATKGTISAIVLYINEFITTTNPSLPQSDGKRLSNSSGGNFKDQYV